MTMPPWWVKAIVLAGAVLLVAAGVHHYNEALRQDGRDEIQAKWDARERALAAAALQEELDHARESLRRIERQKANQDARDRAVAAAMDAAARNARAADQLREQRDDAARKWRDALAHSATGEQCAAAGDAIGVLADVLGRADRRAGILAKAADAAHLAGQQCERDYDALRATQLSPPLPGAGPASSSAP